VRECLVHLSANQGDDPEFLAMELNISAATMRRYVWELKRRGYVYTARFQFTEVWLTKKGKEVILQ
jgi:hypothetical protein